MKYATPDEKKANCIIIPLHFLKRGDLSAEEIITYAFLKNLLDKDAWLKQSMKDEEGAFVSVQLNGLAHTLHVSPSLLYGYLLDMDDKHYIELSQGFRKEFLKIRIADAESMR